MLSARRVPSDPHNHVLSPVNITSCQPIDTLCVLWLSAFEVNTMLNFRATIMDSGWPWLIPPWMVQMLPEQAGEVILTISHLPLALLQDRIIHRIQRVVDLWPE